jgi:hypothetical protein
LRVRAQRKIPLALTSATLTFGACGGGTKDSDVTDGDIVEAVERFAEAVCKTAQRCDRVAFERDFENLRGCVEYYKDYYSDYYADLDNGPDVDDPAGCRRAVNTALDCVTRSYTNLSCEAFNGDDYTEGDEGEDPCEDEFDELDLACELEDEPDDGAES